MTAGIFLIRDDGSFIEMKEQAYDSEVVLQELLEKYPQLVAGDAIDAASPRRWVLVKREAGVPREDGGSSWWSADHLLLDQDGVPTIVEVKRSTDTRIRRQVVGQMLDYAANAVVYWPLGTLQAWFADTCGKKGLETDFVLAGLLGPDGDIEEFWQRVKTNLEARRIRMVFVADVIPDELRRIVEFLNEQMTSAEVLAIEVRQFVGLGSKTLVPHVIGNTARADEAKRPAGIARRFKWDEHSFLEAIDKNATREQATVARRLLSWAKMNCEGVEYGTGAARGSFLPRFAIGAGGFKPIAVYSDGTLTVQFVYLDKVPSLNAVERRKELRDRLNLLPGVDVPDSALNGSSSFSLSLLTKDELFSQFVAVLEWAVGQARQPNTGTVEA